MPIELSTQLIHASIAQVLQSIDPNAEIFDNPTQQGSPYPAWYIVHRQPVERQREVGNRYVLVYYIDIWYMLKQNITRLYDQYTVVAEQLEERMEHLPIYGYEGVVVHTHDNSWGLELNAMKYSITLRLRCSRNTAPVEKMRVIEDLQVFIKGLGLLKKIHYLCSQFPQFDMGIETFEYCRYGDSITLPVVSGIYRDSDGVRWEPLAWDVGQMGETFGPVLDDITINLFMGEVIGLDTCIGGTVGVGENVGKDIVWRVQGMTRTDWRTSGPIRALEVDAGVSGGADLSRDEWAHVGPVKEMAGEPVMGGTVEKYTPPTSKLLYLSATKQPVRVSNPGMFSPGYPLYNDDGTTTYFNSEIPELLSAWTSADGEPIEDFILSELQLEKNSGNVAAIRFTSARTYFIQRVEVSNYD